METKFVKGRWYKQCGNYYRHNKGGLSFDCSVREGVCKAVFTSVNPYSPIEEVSPNEVLQSIKTEGLSPEQLKEIAEVFFVEGVRLTFGESGFGKSIFGKPMFFIEGDFIRVCFSNETFYDSLLIRKYNKWATIIKHPAYGDQDLREYGKVKKKGGYLGTISASFNFQDGRFSVSQEIADGLNGCSFCKSDQPETSPTLITQAFKLSDRYSWKIDGNYLVPTEK